MTKKLESKSVAVAGEEPDPWSAPALSPERQAECAAGKASVMARPDRPHMRLNRDDAGKPTLSLGTNEPDSDVLNSIRFFVASGSSSNQFVGHTLRQLLDVVRLSGDDAADSSAVGAAAALIAGVDPQNEVESTMALQMVAANEAALMFFGRARRAEFMEHASAYANMANKAMRAFALHAEAIAKLRRGGEQVVKHVHVGDGGQAVIAGTVNTGGRG